MPEKSIGGVGEKIGDSKPVFTKLASLNAIQEVQNDTDSTASYETKFKSVNQDATAFVVHTERQPNDIVLIHDDGYLQNKITSTGWIANVKNEVLAQTQKLALIRGCQFNAGRLETTAAGLGLEDNITSFMQAVSAIDDVIESRRRSN